MNSFPFEASENMSRGQGVTYDDASGLWVLTENATPRTFQGIVLSDVLSGNQGFAIMDGLWDNAPAPSGVDVGSKIFLDVITSVLTEDFVDTIFVGIAMSSASISEPFAIYIPPTVRSAAFVDWTPATVAIAGPTIPWRFYDALIDGATTELYAGLYVPWGMRSTVADKTGITVFFTADDETADFDCTIDVYLMGGEGSEYANATLLVTSSITAPPVDPFKRKSVAIILPLTVSLLQGQYIMLKFTRDGAGDANSGTLYIEGAQLDV